MAHPNRETYPALLKFKFQSIETMFAIGSVVHRTYNAGNPTKSTAVYIHFDSANKPECASTYPENLGFWLVFCWQIQNAWPHCKQNQKSRHECIAENFRMHDLIAKIFRNQDTIAVLKNSQCKTMLYKNSEIKTPLCEHTYIYSQTSSNVHYSQTIHIGLAMPNSRRVHSASMKQELFYWRNKRRTW